jgi:tetratricopeptide (TPR) repeat protein
LAVEDFSAAIRLAPEDADILDLFAARGEALVHLGLYQQALIDFDVAISIDPGDPGYYLLRGNAHRALMQYENAVDDLGEAIRLDLQLPTERYLDRVIEMGDGPGRVTVSGAPSDAYKIRGMAYNGLGQYQRALSDLNQAVRLAPEDIEAYLNRGVSFFNSGDHLRAMADFNSAAALDPSNAIPLVFRGVARSILGLKSQSQTDLAYALKSGLPADLLEIYLQEVKTLFAPG